MIHLTDYIQKENFLVLDPDSKKEAISILARHCLQSYPEDIRDLIMEDMLRKTPGKNINMGRGFGITHTRTDRVEHIEVSVGLFKEECKIFGKDTIHTLFCIVIPHHKSRIYLSFIAHLSRLLSTPQAYEVFLAGKPENILHFIQQTES